MKKVLVLLVLCYAIAGAQTITTVKVTQYYGVPNVLVAYTAGDIVADSSYLSHLINFPNVAAYASGSGQILSATLTMDSINVTNGTFRLHLFKDSTNSVDGITIDTLADNGAYVIKTGQRSYYIGHIDFTLIAGPTGSTMSYAQNTAPNITFTVGSRYRSLFGVLTATGAYTRKYTGTFDITLRIKKD